MADNNTIVKLMRKMGPNLMPEPQVGSKFMSGLLTLTRAAKTGTAMLSDDDPAKISSEAFKNYLGHFPAGTSFMCADHFRQMMLAERFQRYDHGVEKNLEKYGSETPPEISLATFSDLPIALFCGSGDKLASPHDYMWLRDELVAHNNCIYYKEYDMGHLAFLMPADKTIYREMLALIKRYNTVFRTILEPTQEESAAEGAVAMNVANMTLTQGAFSSDNHRINIIDDFLTRL